MLEAKLGSHRFTGQLRVRTSCVSQETTMVRIPVGEPDSAPVRSIKHWKALPVAAVVRCAAKRLVPEL